MPVTYTNRKGVTYTLCRIPTKTGKTRYVFVRDPTGRETVAEIPKGWEIHESVNGVSCTSSSPTPRPVTSAPSAGASWAASATGSSWKAASLRI
jgi:hypothetical protein